MLFFEKLFLRFIDGSVRFCRANKIRLGSKLCAELRQNCQTDSDLMFRSNFDSENGNS